MVHFSETVGLYADEAQTIREELQTKFQEIFATKGTLNVTPASPAGQIIDSITALTNQKDTEVLYLGNMFNPKTAVGRWQEALGAIYFLDRIVASPTVVTCTCKGLYGTVIPIGSIVATISGVQFKSLDPVTIPISEEIDVEFECTESGPVEIAAHTCTKIITTVPGWDTVDNAAEGITGTNEETQSAFEHRRENTVANNAHGSVAAVDGALWKVDGVKDLQVFNNPTDLAVVSHGVQIAGHSVAVCIYGGLATDIAETLYLKLNAGCGTSGNTVVSYTAEDTTENKYYIYRPTEVPVYVNVRIRKTSTTPSTIETDIKDAIIADANGLDVNSENERVSLGSTLYGSRFSVCVIKTADVDDLIGITVGRSAGSTSEMVSFNGDEEPIFDETRITVTIVTT